MAKDESKKESPNTGDHPEEGCEECNGGIPFMIGVGTHFTHGINFPCVYMAKADKQGEAISGTRIDIPPAGIPRIVALLLEAGAEALKQSDRTIAKGEDGKLYQRPEGSVN